MWYVVALLAMIVFGAIAADPPWRSAYIGANHPAHAPRLAARARIPVS